MINDGTINGFPINGESHDPYVSFVNSWSGVSTETLRLGLSFSDALLHVSSEDNQVSWVLSESPVYTDSLIPQGTYLYNLAETLSATTAVSQSLLLDLLTSFSNVETGEFTRNVVASFVEAILLTAPLASQHNAWMNLAEAIAQTNTLSSGFGQEFSEAFGVANVTNYNQALSIVESLVLAETMTNTMRLFVTATESVGLSETLTLKGNLALAFEEGVVIGGIINLPDGVYEAWIVNAENQAPYQYDNYPFNSFATINRLPYGVAEDGLYLLTGDDDAGTDIAAEIKTGLTNMGTTLFKRVPRVYIGYSADKPCVMKTITTEDGVKTERWYELKDKTADEITNARIKLARGVKSVYWQFELINTDGGDFDIDDIKLLPMTLRRRR